jgi:tetratricopeptide (TPR) repeat protein
MLVVARAACLSFFGILLIFSEACNAQAAPLGRLENQLTQLVNQGDYDTARLVLANTPHARSEELLLEGRIHKAQGNTLEAVTLLEQALRLKPNDLRIRRELAHTLYLANKLSKATYQLNRLIYTDPNPLLRRAYRSLKSKIGKQRPFEWQTYFSIEPSTNVNRGSTQDSFSTVLGDLDIDEDSRATSGVGVTAGLSGSFQLRASGRSLTRLSLTYSKTVYSEEPQFNFDRSIIAIVHRFDIGQTAWTIAPFKRNEFRQDQSDSSALGLTIAAKHFFNAKTRLSLATTFEDRTFDASTGNNGSFKTFFAALEHDLSPTFSLGGKLALEQSRPKTEHINYDGISVTLSATKYWPGGFVGKASVYAGHRGFDGTIPLTTIQRSDDYWGIGASVKMNRWFIGSLSPVVRCRYEKNGSNAALFDFDAFGCGLHLTRTF